MTRRTPLSGGRRVRPRVEHLEDRITPIAGDLLHTLADPGPALADQFGVSVAVDGNTLVVGCPFDDPGGVTDAGSVYVFNLTTGALTATIPNPFPAAGDEFGFSVVVSQNKTALWVGAPFDDPGGVTDSGAAYEFLLDGSPFLTLNNPSPAAGDQFAYSLATNQDGSLLAIGAPGDDFGATDAGRAYITQFNFGGISSYGTVSNPTPAAGDRFGTSVAVTIFGQLLVGCPFDDPGGVTDAGSVTWYDFNAAGVIATLNNPSPAAGDQFGASVAIGGNSLLAVVGAPFDDPGGVADAGTAYVFDANLGGETFDALVATLNNPAPAAGDHFGASVAVSDFVAVVGAPQDDPGGVTDAGSAYEFRAPTGGLIATLTNPSPTAGDRFGTVAAYRARAAVGTPLDDPGGTADAGTAYVFDLNSPPVATSDTAIVPKDAGPTPVLALGDDSYVPDVGELRTVSAVTQGANGGTVAIAAPGSIVTYAPPPGFVGTDTFTYTASDGRGGTATATVTVTVTNPPNPAPAVSVPGAGLTGVGVAASGTRMVIGSGSSSDPTGVYDIATGALLTPLVPTGGADFGTPVAISGNLVAVADFQTATGIVRLFDATTGALLHTLTPPAGNNSYWFGHSVAIDGNTVVVGTYEDYSAFGNPSPSRPGRVYVYDGTTGALVRTITNPTPGYTEEGFGTAVAVQGNTLVVGAYMSYVAGNLPLGHVYVYDLSTGNLVRTLNDPAAGFNNLFGLAVSISGDRIAVGAREAVYLFDATTGARVATLGDPTPTFTDQFGSSVSLSGNRVLVGAPTDDPNGVIDAGAAYLFDATTGMYLRSFTRPSPAAGDQFGNAVALLGNRAVVGAWQQTVNGVRYNGGAYVFDTTFPPTARDDALTLPEDSPATVVNVLGNDSTMPDTGETLAVTAVTQPATGGTVTLTGGVVRFAPAPDFNGTTSFTYTVSDGNGGTATATVNVTVTPVNDPPAANPDTLTLPEDSPPTVVDVLANDSSAPDVGEALTVTAVTQPAAGGSVTLSAGVVRFAPAADFNGSTSFTYTISDGNGGFATATVSVTVTPVNDPPTANPDTVTTAEDSGPTVVDVLANDTTAPDTGETLTVTAVTQPAHGTVTLVGGAVRYAPAPDYNGPDGFGYTISDGNGGTATATVSVIVTAVNDAPVATGAATLPAVPEDTNNPLGATAAALFAANFGDAADQVPGGSSANTLAGVAVVGNAATAAEGAWQYSANGTTWVPVGSPSAAAALRVAAGGRFRFVPAADYNGTPGGLTVRLIDSSAGAVATGSTANLSGSGATGGTSPYSAATVPLSTTITPVNDAPVVATNETTALAYTENAGPVAVTPSLTVADVDSPTLASATVTLNGFVPGEDALGFAAAPGITGSFANGVLSLTGSATVAAYEQTLRSVTYTNSSEAPSVPARSVRVAVSDGQASSSPVTRSITVTPVNDPPVVSANAGLTLAEGSSAAIGSTRLRATDPDNPPAEVVFTLTAAPAHGTLTNGTTALGVGATVTQADIDAGRLGYAHDGSETTTDGFTFTVTDGTATTGPATFAITVTPVNDAPIAVNDAPTTAEDAVGVFDVRANDTDAEGNALTVTGVGRPAHGTAATDGATVTYTPDPNYFGPDSFTYTLSDGQGGTATATVNVTVTPVNDPPTANADAVTVAEDSGPTAVAVLANDTTAPDTGETLTVTAVTQPANGAVTLSGGVVRFAPAPDFNGVTSFTYTVSDGNSGTATATVVVTVTPVDDAPMVTAGGVAVYTENAPPVAVAPGLTLSDVDSAILTGGTVAITGGFAPGQDVLAFTPVGAITGSYDPTAGVLTLTGSDTVANYQAALRSVAYRNPADAPAAGDRIVTFVASDGQLSGAPAAVTVSLITVNDPPAANDDAAVTAEDTPVTVAVLGNDTDPDGDALAVAAVTQPAHGSAAVTAGGVTYTPAADFAGTDGFTYTVSDGNGGAAAATVTVTVTPVNDNPTAAADAFTLVGGTRANRLPVLANDTAGPDHGESLAVAAVTQPAAGGSAAVAADGSAVLFTPAAGFNGTAAFTYTVSDGHGGTATAGVTVTVAGGLPFAASGRADGTVAAFVPDGTGGYAGPAAVPGPFAGSGTFVRAATADVDGDGFADTVLVTGPGVKAAYAVVSGKDHATLLVPPSDPVGDANFTAGLYVSAGDIDGDGKAEWVISPEDLGGPRTIIFHLAGGAPVLVSNHFGISDSEFRGGERTTLGDVNGDGFLDVVCIAAAKGGPRLAVFDGRSVMSTGLSGTPAKLLANDIFVADPASRAGLFVAAGDVNGDGFADIVATNDPTLGSGSELRVLSGADLARQNPTPALLADFAVAGFDPAGGLRVGTTDIDGDGRADVAVGSGAGQPSSVKVYLGRDLTPGPEPASQVLDPFGGAVLTDGVFVG